MNIVKDVPDSLYHAICNDRYNSGESDYTPSSLNQPAYQLRMYREHKDKLTENASACIWRLFGTAVHAIAEQGAEKVDHVESERRFYGTIGTAMGHFKIGSQVDVFDRKALGIEDYKVTSVWSHGKQKDEWVSQLNVGRWCIYQETGILVEKLTIIAIYRDWSARDSAIKSDYPKAQVAEVFIPLWTLEYTEAWIRDKVEERERALRNPSIEDVTPCSDEEVWGSPSKFAVMMPGGSRALKVFDDSEEANGFSAVKKGSYVDERPGERKRCASYCAASEICPAYQAWKLKHGK